MNCGGSRDLDGKRFDIDIYIWLQFTCKKNLDGHFTLIDMKNCNNNFHLGMDSLKSILRYLRFCSASEERESSSDVFIAESEKDDNEDNSNSGNEENENKKSERKNEKEKEKKPREKDIDSEWLVGEGEQNFDPDWLDQDNEKEKEKDEAYEIERINKVKYKNFINVRWIKNTEKGGFDYVVLQAAQCTAKGMELRKPKFEFKNEDAVWGFLELEPNIDKLNLQHLLLRGVTDFAIKFFAEYYIKAREREAGEEEEEEETPKYIEEQRIFSYLLDKNKFRDFKSHFEKEVKAVYQNHCMVDMNGILYNIAHRDHQREQIKRLIWSKIQKKNKNRINVLPSTD